MYNELGYGHWLSDRIENNEVFPVGGTFPGSLDQYMKVDFDIFQQFFERIAENQKKIEKNEALKKWFSDAKVDFDYSLFCHMYAFNLVMKDAFPDASKNVDKRTGFYEGKGKRYLSEGVSRGYCACTEFSILAQGYFQSQDIPTRYVGGELVSNGDFDNFEPHCFIAFQSGGKEYVFDPVNPVPLGLKKVPRIAEFVGKKDNEYLETKCLFNNDKWYYSGGYKGAFLRDLPSKNTLKKTLDKGLSKKMIQRKDVQNG